MSPQNQENVFCKDSSVSDELERCSLMNFEQMMDAISAFDISILDKSQSTEDDENDFAIWERVRRYLNGIQQLFQQMIDNRSIENVKKRVDHVVQTLETFTGSLLKMRGNVAEWFKVPDAAEYLKVYREKALEIRSRMDEPALENLYGSTLRDGRQQLRVPFSGMEHYQDRTGIMNDAKKADLKRKCWIHWQEIRTSMRTLKELKKCNDELNEKILANIVLIYKTVIEAFTRESFWPIELRIKVTLDGGALSSPSHLLGVSVPPPTLAAHSTGTSHETKLSLEPIAKTRVEKENIERLAIPADSDAFPTSSSMLSMLSNSSDITKKLKEREALFAMQKMASYAHMPILESQVAESRVKRQPLRNTFACSAAKLLGYKDPLIGTNQMADTYRQGISRTPSAVSNNLTNADKLTHAMLTRKPAAEIEKEGDAEPVSDDLMSNCRKRRHFKHGALEEPGLKNSCSSYQPDAHTPLIQYPTATYPFHPYFLGFQLNSTCNPPVGNSFGTTTPLHNPMSASWNGVITPPVNITPRGYHPQTASYTPLPTYSAGPKQVQQQNGHY